jgi:hypothetical protein
MRSSNGTGGGMRPGLIPPFFCAGASDRFRSSRARPGWSGFFPERAPNLQLDGLLQEGLHEKTAAKQDIQVERSGA